MELQFIDHFTLSVRPHELESLREFYTETFGLEEGRRPNFPFPATSDHQGIGGKPLDLTFVGSHGE